MDWNPLNPLKRGWEKATTSYGKLSLVLFYSLLGVLLLTNTWSLVDPRSRICIIEAAGSHHEEFAKALIRSLSVVWIGFLWYAHCRGPSVANVMTVTVVVAIFHWAFLPIAHLCKDSPLLSFLSAILPVWSLLAMVFAWIEDNTRDRGTAEEIQSLVV